MRRKMPAFITSPDGSGRRALVVGVDPATLRMFHDALHSSGFAVDAVDSGIDAIISARNGHPGLIVMEIQLRDVPGCEAIKWLRSLPALKSTPIIVLTAEAEDDAALSATGPSLRKPVSPAAIWRTIREALE